MNYEPKKSNKMEHKFHFYGIEIPFFWNQRSIILSATLLNCDTNTEPTFQHALYTKPNLKYIYIIYIYGIKIIIIKIYIKIYRYAKESIIIKVIPKQVKIQQHIKLLMILMK